MLFDNDNLSDLPDLEPPEKHKDKNGKMEFAGTITRCDPPNVFAHTWEFGEYASEVSYELTEQGDQVLLVLTHSRLQSSEDELLDDVLEGRKIRPYWKTYRHYDAEYSARLGRTD
jgi:2-hydroxy-3-keto-5-methylthiopentenyl-1-phosphate phosphatase